MNRLCDKSKIKNLRVRTTAFILSGISFCLMFSSLPDREYHPTYTINEEYDKSDTKNPFATTSHGDVYIGKLREMKRLENKVDSNSILIVDQRGAKDPNMKIKSSHEITDKDEMEEILEVVQIYNETYPSDWDRSTEAMMNEWEVHNICSDLSIFPSHTDEVDFNNGDELLYSPKILTKILRN